MSYTLCDLCPEPLLGYQGSACTNDACENRPHPDDPNPAAKSIDGKPYRFRVRAMERAAERVARRPFRRAFRGII